MIGSARAEERRARARRLPTLGVGVSFQPSLLPFFESSQAAFDFVEIIPDTLWVDTADGGPDRYREDDEAHRVLARLLRTKPLVAHSIGLSIGSAERFDVEHVAQIARWQQRYGFPWHSDHLSFNRLEQPSGHSLDVGLTMPVPYDGSVLDLVAERTDHVLAAVPVPFLLENNVYYFEIPEQEMSEPEFLNALAARTGCGLLLDVHNVYVNARNHGFDARDFFSALDLEHVVELHLAGGLELDGTYLDAHAGPCPEPVWELAAEIVPHAPYLRAIVFEVLDSHYPDLGPDALTSELARARDLLRSR
jgi:uncharacterized protein (UPF0276 family)